MRSQIESHLEFVFHRPLAGEPNEEPDLLVYRGAGRSFDLALEFEKIRKGTRFQVSCRYVANSHTLLEGKLRAWPEFRSLNNDHSEAPEPAVATRSSAGERCLG